MRQSETLDGKRARSDAAGAGRTLTYGLLDALGRAIVTGRYDTDPFPTESALAKHYAISRSVTREAVKMLTAKGLLTARPRSGTSVQPAANWNLFDPDVLRWLLDRKFSLDLLRQFSELRFAIEPAAAALAAGAASDARIAAIQAGHDRMVAAEKGEDDALESDVSFHIAVLRASENPFYAQFQDVVTTALRTSIRFTNQLTNRAGGRTASLAQHQAVLDAIVRRQPDAARIAMADLIAEVMALIADAERKG